MVQKPSKINVLVDVALSVSDSRAMILRISTQIGSKPILALCP